MLGLLALVALFAAFSTGEPIKAVLVEEPPPPPTTCAGLRVTAQNSTFGGYVSAKLDSEKRYVTTRTASEAKLSAKFENNTLFSQNGDGKYPTFGATFGFYWDTPPGNPNFAAGAQNYAYFNSVAAMKLGDKPAKVASSFNEVGTNPTTGGKRDAPSESAIFYLNTSTGEITAKWVNTDGSFVTAYFIINTQRRINISGDTKRYYEEWDGTTAQLYCEKAPSS